MDAKSLHNHNTPSSTRQRIHAKTTDEPSGSDNFFKNEEAIKSELQKEAFDQDGDGVVSLMEELNSAEDAKATADEATAELKTEDPVSIESEEEKENEKEKENDILPKAAILTMVEEKKPTFNAFSSAHASSPLPQQNRQVPIEEAKPVKDNTNAIIMILLIAILLIAVAIFSVIVLSQYRNDHAAPTSIDTSKTNPNNSNDDDSGKDAQYDYSAIVGKWITTSNNNKCLIIKEGGEVSWYTMCKDTEKDYYVGKAKITRGQDAIDLLGITKERAMRKVGLSSDEVSLSNIYVLSIEPTEYMLDGERIAKPEKINILFIYTKDNEAQAYDYNYGDIYILNRSADE